MKTKISLTWQTGSMQCGAACLHMICKYWGQEYPLDHLANLCNISVNGTSLLNMNEAANAIGLKTICKKTDIETLIQAPLPCILHWNNNHFVVLYKVKSNKFYIANPSKGFEKFDIQKFQYNWTGENEASKGIAMFIKPAETFFKQDVIENNENSSKFLLKYGKPHYKQFLLIIIGLLLAGALQLVLPFLTQSIVDVGIKERGIYFVWLMLLGQLMLVIARTAIDFARRWILLHLSLRIHISLIGDFFIKLLKLPMSFFDTKLMGDLMQRMNDHNRLNTFLTQQMLNAVYSLFTFVAFSIVLLCYSKVVFLVFLVGSILYVLWISCFFKRRKLIDYEMFEIQAVNSNITYDFITSATEIKLQNCEERQRNKWISTQELLFDVQLKSLKLQQKLEAGSIFINEVKNIVVIFIAAIAVINNQMTLGMMMALMFIIGQLNSPIEQLISFVYSLQDVRISLERIKSIHEKPNEDIESKQLKCLVNEKQGIEFNNVSFSYSPYSAFKTISDINIQIPHGKVSAIVGTSGSGKTTLIRLMLGYNVVSEGNLFIGSVDINHINKKWWRNKCGVVMQEGFIFSESIAQNIAIGDDNINDEKLLRAAEIACIKDYVMSLPQKFDTKIGRDGIELSKGQKQRILIARAVYKNPDYIFLDEATNSLDANNEKSIVDNLRAFYKGKTVVIAAHRLSTVKDADQIIVIDKGYIVEVGNHDSLIAKQGIYHNLVKNQLAI